MRLTPNTCTLPLLAGLICSIVACSEGSTTPAGGDGGADTTGTGGKSGTTTTTDGGGVTSTTTTPASGGSTAVAFTKCFNFETTTEGWQKNYASISLATDKSKRDEVASATLLSDTTADWMDLPGYGGTNGFVKFTIPYQTSQVEYQGFLYSYLPTPGIDLTNKTVHAFVRLVSGMTADDPSKPSGAKLVVKSGADYFYADGGWVNLAKNEWKEILISVSVPANLDMNKAASMYDPSDIREISVEIDTSGSATTVVSPGIVYLDKVCY